MLLVLTSSSSLTTLPWALVSALSSMSILDCCSWREVLNEVTSSSSLSLEDNSSLSGNINDSL